MHRSKIEWCDHTWNPVTGCRHGCPYCYARKMTKRFSGDVRLNLQNGGYTKEEAPDGSGDLYILDKPFLNETGNPLAYPFGFEPTLYRYRMNTLDKLKMGNNIFVGAMADIFGEWVPDEWIDEIFGVCMEKTEHNFLFLTKNPRRYMQYGVPTGRENLWYGATITSTEDMNRIASLVMDAHTYVSIEPIHGRFSSKDLKTICSVADWIIVGAESGHRAGKIIPEFDWIKDIVLAADTAGKPVFMKDSLIGIVGEENMRRVFPPQLLHKTVSSKLRKKLYDNCAMCGAHLKKSSMLALLVRSAQGRMVRQYGFMCRDCLEEFCNTHGLTVPDFENTEGERDGKDAGK